MGQNREKKGQKEGYEEARPKQKRGQKGGSLATLFIVLNCTWDLYMWFGYILRPIIVLLYQYRTLYFDKKYKTNLQVYNSDKFEGSGGSKDNLII